MYLFTRNVKKDKFSRNKNLLSKGQYNKQFNLKFFNRFKTINKYSFNRSFILDFKKKFQFNRFITNLRLSIIFESIEYRL